MKKDHILRETGTSFRNMPALEAVFLNLAYWFLTIGYLELVLRLAVFDELGRGFAFALGFGFVIAAVVAAVLSLLPGKAGFPVSLIVTVFLVLLFASQIVYNAVFRTLYSVALMRQGGAAITTYWREVLQAMADRAIWLLLLLLPVGLLIAARKFLPRMFEKTSWSWRAAVVLLAALVQILCVTCLSAGGTGYFTDHYFYYSDSTTADQAIRRFGLLTAFRLDIFSPDPGAGKTDNGDYYVPTQPTEPAGGSLPQEVVQEYNVLDIDFDALSAMTEEEKIRAINSYCASLTGTNKNEYTGMLSDYNLILLCAESFSSGAIHEELTPTLYRLANEGIIFKNFYNTFPSNTTDGEYTLCMGLYPDTSRSKSLASFYASRGSYLPYCLGNIFAEQRDIRAYGYHSNVGSFYGRDESHPNMGYVMKFDQDGMEFSPGDPKSDLEMMEQSVDEYIGQEQFHAYYMTYSGHIPYNEYGNPITKKNIGLVRDREELTYFAQSYLACNIELDRALEYLMQRLEEQGVADRTAIVLVGDHYPYGLSDEDYSSLVGYEIDNFTKWKSSLIFWVGGLEESIVVEEYCSTADILPTILNLWGFDYDSRMLTGTDVFSDGTHVAVLSSMSFYTDKVWLDAGSGEVRYLVPESELPENYVDNMIKLVQTRFSLSKDILNTAYYNFVFGVEDVDVNWETWGQDPDVGVLPPPVETTPASPSVPEETQTPAPTEAVPVPSQDPGAEEPPAQ